MATRRRPDGGTTPPSSRSATPTSPQIVVDDVLPEPLDVRGEDAPTVAAGDGVHEAPQPRVLAQHEDVDRGAVAGEHVDLGDGGLDGLPHRRPVEEGVAAV